MAFLRGMILGLSVAAPIGPVNIVVMRTALAHGAITAMATGAGAATVDATYLGISLFGSAALHLRPWMNAVISLVGGLFLLRLAVNTYRASPSPERLDGPSGGTSAGPSTRKGAFGGYATGIAATVVNPVTILFWMSVGSAMATSVSGAGLGLTYAGVLAGVLTWFTFVSNLFSLARGRLSLAALRVINVVCAAVLLFYSVKFLWSAYSIISSQGFSN
ncbi:MAG: LysE family transporter [Ignavibacteriales bacterium]